MKVKLSIFERISIPVNFPEKATFADAIIYDDIRNKIKITQNDVVTYNIRNTKDGSGVEWDNEPNDGGVDFDFTEMEKNLIIKSFKDLDQKGQIPTDSKFITLYKKFIN